jgi:hypothetical protein
MRILRYFSLRGLDEHHTRVYPRRSLGLVDYSEPHPYTTTDVSYRSVLIYSNGSSSTSPNVQCLCALPFVSHYKFLPFQWESNPYLVASTTCTSLCAFIPYLSRFIPVFRPLLIPLTHTLGTLWGRNQTVQ